MLQHQTPNPERRNPTPYTRNPKPETFSLDAGIRIARRLLLEINALGLPTGCEFLDTISPQFLADLVSWGAIGARTTESQVHRELASGLSMPIGFKNGTSGWDIKIACDAITSSSFAHSFLSVTHQGTVAIVSTTGNKDCHLILRGGADKTNFDQESVARCVALLQKAKVTANVVIDCSHGNSQKLHANQPKVSFLTSGLINPLTTETRTQVMIESNLVEGAQPLTDGKALVYGQSITDACIDWNTTTTVLPSPCTSRGMWVTWGLQVIGELRRIYPISTRRWPVYQIRPVFLLFLHY
ncbi:hypothetical protein T484DRAFT_1625836 [Baffinella frigidus]|nr:hypothetical protein T484DRAFT_1625836 [Cryptophyta sp. CCMP2293]